MKGLKDVFQLILGTAYLADASRWYSASNTTNAGNYSTNSTELSQARDSWTFASRKEFQKLYSRPPRQIPCKACVESALQNISHDSKGFQNHRRKQQRLPIAEIVIVGCNDIVILVKSCEVLNGVRFFQCSKLSVR